MKPYFAKFIPVEGEIKKGDYYIDNSLAKNTLHFCRENPSEDLNTSDHICKKVKLFLCSGDIKPEDFASRESRVHVSFNNPEPPFKIIGEISPDARWVKEGDEFLGPEAGEKCEVLPLHRHDVVTEEMIFVDKYGEQVETPIYLIKGPCGHFH